MSGAILMAGGSDGLRAVLEQTLGGFGRIVAAPEAALETVEAWAATVERAVAEHGRVRGLVNMLDLANASSMPIQDVGYAAFDAAFLATVGKGFSALKAVVPVIAASGGGFALTILEHDAGDEDGALQPMAAGGLTMMTRAVAAEYTAPPSTRINLILRDRDRLGGEAVAGLARYLCGPDSAYATGAVLGQTHASGVA